MIWRSASTNAEVPDELAPAVAVVQAAPSTSVFAPVTAWKSNDVKWIDQGGEELHVEGRERAVHRRGARRCPAPCASPPRTVSVVPLEGTEGDDAGVLGPPPGALPVERR